MPHLVQGQGHPCGGVRAPHEGLGTVGDSHLEQGVMVGTAQGLGEAEAEVTFLLAVTHQEGIRHQDVATEGALGTRGTCGGTSDSRDPPRTLPSPNDSLPLSPKAPLSTRFPPSPNAHSPCPFPPTPMSPSSIPKDTFIVPKHPFFVPKHHLCRQGHHPLSSNTPPLSPRTLFFVPKIVHVPKDPIPLPKAFVPCPQEIPPCLQNPQGPP